jgi:hypothetical protein
MNGPDWPWEVNEPGAQSALERRYRRLLSFYPAEHRRSHEQEMLGVLLAGAHADQRWPRLAESVDLAWGGLLIRVRLGRRGSADPGWRDALALFSVVLPLCMLTYMLAELAIVGDLAALLELRRGALGPGQALLIGILLVLTALVLLRLRRSAALFSAAVMACGAVGCAVDLVRGSYAPMAEFYMVGYGLEAAALAASPGPRHGLTLLKWRGGIVLVVAGVATAAVVTGGLELAFPYVPRVYPALSSHAAALVMMAGGAATMTPIVAGAALSSNAARRMLALLAGPASAFFVPFLRVMLLRLTPTRSVVLVFGPGWLAAVCPLAILCVAAVAAWRSRTRRAAPTARPG